MKDDQKDYFGLTLAEFKEAVHDFQNGPCSEYSYEASTLRFDTIDGEWDGYQATIIFTAEPWYHQKYAIEIHSTAEGVRICCGEECYLECDSAGLFTYLYHEAAELAEKREKANKYLRKAYRYQRASMRLAAALVGPTAQATDLASRIGENAKVRYHITRRLCDRIITKLNLCNQRAKGAFEDAATYSK
ncbi:hypothetical protein [Pseudodesulfovibrio sediminis]|uniref:Transposase n=1 Tax=Pseudodesulfovibrio sediminis TaxID=2810563 RepID=A0ABN6EMQ3_9BACT|nr:hypothetical protein [Pseudodesulfovibrio sediminis]BCS87361.1 hypothetical protein PSDVSF_06030 [Pseudodesulfovibrio sediminis]